MIITQIWQWHNMAHGNLGKDLNKCLMLSYKIFVFGLIGLMKVNKQIINVHAAAAVQDQRKGFNLF